MAKLATLSIALTALAMVGPQAQAGIQFYGNENVLNSGTAYASDPTAGATLQGLAPGDFTEATLITGHDYPFVPTVGDFPGTDQIYVGSTQTGAHDGYSGSSQRINGPDVMTLDYSGLVGSGGVSTLTLGIAADDFQFPAIGNAFTASINGTTDTGLTTLLNSLNEGGPVVQFVTIGIPTSELTANNKLVLSIDEGGDGGDGYAVDFLTVGVTPNAVPEPATAAMLLALPAAALLFRRRGRDSTKP